MSKKPDNKKPEAKNTRIELLLRSRELIKEYIDTHFDDLLKLRNGSVVVQTVCQDLGIFENSILIEIANSVWLERVSNEMAKNKTKEGIKRELRGQSTASPKPSKAPQTAQDAQKSTSVPQALVSVIQQREREQEAETDLLVEALVYLADQLSRTKPSIWERIKSFLEKSLRL